MPIIETAKEMHAILWPLFFEKGWHILVDPDFEVFPKFMKKFGNHHSGFRLITYVRHNCILIPKNRDNDRLKLYYHDPTFMTQLVELLDFWQIAYASNRKT